MENDNQKVNCPHVFECRGFDNGDCGSCRNNTSIKSNYYESNHGNPFILLLIGGCAIFGIGSCVDGLQFFLENILRLSDLLSAVIAFFMVIIGISAVAIVYLERRSKNEQKRHS